ncbi:hypothetical protein [Methanobrevibacter sp.]|uniref:hypothetical protein n=1 Tax=Methanobrevibacter sp. TaxID=66852 RepID=UPI0026E017AF|nr:hypothetical protein [Methanobrevibacter sp.]
MISIIVGDSDFKQYNKLKNQKSPLIKKQDLPEDFSDEAYGTICDFIEKTRGLNYEWLIYFDYVTGDFLKCVKGKEDSADLSFEDENIRELIDDVKVE